MIQKMECGSVPYIWSMLSVLGVLNTYRMISVILLLQIKKTEQLTPPFFGRKTTFTKVGMSRTSSLYSRSWSRTRMMSTSKAWATWVNCLYPSPFTHPQVLMITPEAFASTNDDNFKCRKYVTFQHFIPLGSTHLLLNFTKSSLKLAFWKWHTGGLWYIYW